MNVILFINIVLVIIQAVLISIFYLQSKKLGRNSDIIISALSVGVVATFLSLFQEAQLSFISTRSLLSLQLVTFGIEYLLIFVYFNYSVSSNISWKHIAVLFSFFGILIVQSLKYSLIPQTDLDEFLWDFSYNAVGFYAFLYASIILYKSYKYYGSREAAIQAIGTSLLVLGFILGFSSTPFIRNTFQLPVDTIIGDIVKVIGALIFISVFVYNVDFVEHLSIETYGILLYSKSGVELGYYNVRTKSDNKNHHSAIDPALFAPLVSALLTFIKEAMGSSSYLESINSEDKVTIFKVGDKIGVALIAEKSTLLLRKSVANFLQRCENSMISEAKFAQDAIDVETIKQLLHANFPYIEVIE